MATTKYRDFDLNFKPHPVTGDLVMRSETASIIQSLKNLVLLNFYEKPFQPDIGCGLYNMLFEQITTMTALQVQTSIEQVISNYEPRAINVEVSVKPIPSEHKYEVGVVFEPAGTNSPATFTVILERIR